MTIETTIINNLAAEVLVKFGEINSLIEEVSKVAFAKYEADRAALRRSSEIETVEDRRASWLASADHDVSCPIARALSQIRVTMESETKSIENGLNRRTERLADLEADLVQWTEGRAKAANLAAAENAEHVAGDFMVVHAFKTETGKGRDKRFTATVIFLFNGTVYETSEDFDGKAHTFKTRHPERIGHYFTDKRNGTRTELFKAEMTAEEIGKAAYARAAILSALAAQIAA